MIRKQKIYLGLAPIQALSRGWAYASLSRFDDPRKSIPGINPEPGAIEGLGLTPNQALSRPSPPSRFDGSRTKKGIPGINPEPGAIEAVHR